MHPTGHDIWKRNMVLNPNSLSIVTEQLKSFKILQLPLLSRELGLSKEMERKIQTTQRSMERMMLGYTRRDHKTNAWVRDQAPILTKLSPKKLGCYYDEMMLRYQQLPMLYLPYKR